MPVPRTAINVYHMISNGYKNTAGLVGRNVNLMKP